MESPTTLNSHLTGFHTYCTIIEFSSVTTQRLAMFGPPFQIQLLRQSFWIFHQNPEHQYWSFSRIHLLDVKNNSTGWKMSAQDVESAVSAASRAFPAWSGLTPEVTFFNHGYQYVWSLGWSPLEDNFATIDSNKFLLQARAGFLLKIADRIDARLDELALAESRDQVHNMHMAETRFTYSYILFKTR